MGEKTIQRIPVMPFALMQSVISAIIGLIIGVSTAIVFGATTVAMSALPDIRLTQSIGEIGAMFGIGTAVIMPIIGFAGGLVQGIVIAVIYSFLAPRIGGIRLRFKEENTAASKVTSQPFFLSAPLVRMLCFCSARV